MNIANLDFSIDKSNMKSILINFPEQIKKAIEIGEKINLDSINGRYNKILILGMGGSAIGGDLVRSYLSNFESTRNIIIEVSRNYELAHEISDDYLIIASSYSGGTEETLSTLAKLKSTNKVICISSNGELERIATSENFPLIKIPGGLQPRCAIAYSFFSILFCLIKLEIINREILGEIKNSINDTLDKIIELSGLYPKLEVENKAFLIANRIYGKIPVIYSSVNVMDTINLRWRGQIQENAKSFAFGNFIPEMNHNEINGWSNPKDLCNRFVIILICDSLDHPKNKIRFDAVKQIFIDSGSDVIVLQSDEKTLMSRYFELIYLGDWVSYYLAILNSEDPTPIPLISKLKNYLQSN